LSLSRDGRRKLRALVRTACTGASALIVITLKNAMSRWRPDQGCLRADPVSAEEASEGAAADRAPGRAHDGTSGYPRAPTQQLLLLEVFFLVFVTAARAAAFRAALNRERGLCPRQWTLRTKKTRYRGVPCAPLELQDRRFVPREARGGNARLRSGGSFTDILEFVSQRSNSH
jgi:hypothetical protein